MEETMENIQENNGTSLEAPLLEIEGLSEKEVQELIKIHKRFIKAYTARNMNDSEGTWLFNQLKTELPEKSEKEIQMMTKTILHTVEEYGRNLKDLNESCDAGKSVESWFAKKMAESAKGLSVVEYGNYLNGIDNALTNANKQMMRTITTNTDEVSRCINLDGFIAEQEAVNSFNIHAQLEGSPYRAEVQIPGPGETYGKNSFDVVIKDSDSGNIVHQYQFKYGKDAKSTIRLLKDGNYNNQRIVVPPDQVDEVRKAFPGKTVEAQIGGTDKVPVRSEPLTKEQAKQIQKDAQNNGVLPSKDWNAYNTKELAMNIGRNAGIAGLQAAAITTGFTLVEKAVKGEPIDADETVDVALKSGLDAGIKAATTGAVKVGVERGVISVIPKGTPAGIIANIVCVGIENVKIAAKVAKGEMTLAEGIDNMGKTTVSMAYGLGCAANGAAIGATALSWVPVVGPVVGGIVGGMVGYAAGSKFGETIHKGAKAVAKKATTIVKRAGGFVTNMFEKGKKIAKKIGRKMGGKIGVASLRCF